jgi:hypothetical protein
MINSRDFLDAAQIQQLGQNGYKGAQQPVEKPASMSGLAALGRYIGNSSTHPHHGSMADPMVDAQYIEDKCDAFA